MVNKKGFTRTKLVGCFVTEPERKLVKRMARELGFESTSDFLRTILFEFLANLQKQNNNIS